MKKFLATLISLCTILTSLATAISFSVFAEELTPLSTVQIDKTDSGFTIDNHTEGDGVNYADDSYRLVKKLEAVPHTYQAWVKIPNTVNRSEAVGNIIGNYRSSGVPGLIFGIEANNKPSLTWRDEDKMHHQVKFEATTDDADGVVIPYGEWTHLTIVHDEETKAVYLYINGELYGTNTEYYTDIQQASAMRLPMILGGDNRYWNTRYFKGAMSNVALYATALTAAEIKASFEHGVDASDEDLMLLYDITSDDMHADIVDASGNGYDAEYSKLWLSEAEMNEIRKENGMLDENGNYAYSYSFAVVGDTQYVTNYYPQNLPKIYQWIVDNKDTKNIQYVLGVGDITDSDTADVWIKAKNAISIMNGKIEYSLVRGNHDVLNGGDDFDKHFASDPYYTEQFELYGGFFKEGSVENTYRTLRVGNTDWLFLNLDWGPSDEVIDWAIEVVATHPDHKVVISTHGYLTSDGSTIDQSDGDSVDATTRNNGDQIWTKLASQYENVELVLCGHISMNDIVVTQNKGVHGNTVTQMLIDPQRNDWWKTDGITYNRGGAGIVTMLYFNEDGTRINVEHYSTIRGMYHKTCNQLTVDLDAECDEVIEYWDGFTAIQPDGKGTEEAPYLITNAAHLYWISQQMQSAPSGKIFWDPYCVQLNDIDLGGFTLTSIGSYYKGSTNNYRVFGGVYDGNGHVIKNGSIISSAETATKQKTNYYSSGLFGMISGATIRNLTLDNIVSYSARGIVGVLVGSAHPSVKGDSTAEVNLIENCTVTSSCRAVSTVNVGDSLKKNGENSDMSPRVGGIAGALAYTTVRNCVNEATVYIPGNHAHGGGIAGSLYNDCVIDSCINRGEIVIDFTSDTEYSRYNEISHTVGGIVGSIYGYSKYDSSTNNATDGSANDFIHGNIVLNDCQNSGNLVIKGTASAGKALILGGILGTSQKLLAKTDVIIHGCTNSGTAKIEQTQNIPVYVAGIVGYAAHDMSATLDTNSSLKLSSCTNNSTLNAYNQVAVNTNAILPVSETHSYGNKWTDNKNGTHSVPCNCGCGDRLTLTHNWDKGDVTTKATHLLDGVMTYTCTDCGATKTEAISKISAHSFGEWSADTESGTHTSTCECGLTRTHSHAWSGNGTSEEGCAIYKCIYCDEDVSEHAYGKWTDHDDTQHSRSCDCGDVQYEDHTWNSGKILASPTETKTGIKRYICKVCAGTKEEILPMLAPELDEDETNRDEKDSDTVPPDTSEPNNAPNSGFIIGIVIAAVATIGAISVAICLIVKAKKHKS